MACHLFDTKHILNQCWYCHLDPKETNFVWKSYAFIQENAFEIAVWQMAAILSWLDCVMAAYGVIVLYTYIVCDYIWIYHMTLFGKCHLKPPSQRRLSYTDKNVLIVRHGPCELIRLQEMLCTAGQGWRTFVTFGLKWTNLTVWDIFIYLVKCLYFDLCRRFMINPSTTSLNVN